MPSFHLVQIVVTIFGYDSIGKVIDASLNNFRARIHHKQGLNALQILMLIAG